MTWRDEGAWLDRNLEDICAWALSFAVALLITAPLIGFALLIGWLA